MGLVWIVALLLAGFAALWLLGRSAMARSVTELEKSKATIIDFHNDITSFSNGGLKDSQLFDRLAIDCPKVEEALGRDNFVYGVTVGHYLLNGVPILPRALFQIRDAMRSTFDTQTSYQIIAAVRGVLLHSGGRHDLAIERTVHDSRNPVMVTMRGWSLVVAVPLYVLRGAGLLSSGQTFRASSSLLFRLVSIVLFVAAIAGPVLAYLADRAAIEKEVTQLTGGR